MNKNKYPINPVLNLYLKFCLSLQVLPLLNFLIPLDFLNIFHIFQHLRNKKFQQGILIGYVTDIQVDSSNMTKTAYLTPVVDFEHLEDVLIITELKESFELEEK